MSSCQDALINNIFTNLQNFDSTIVFSLEKRRLKKIWLAAANKRDADLANGYAPIDAKYNSGFYVRRSYPGIPQDVIDRSIRALNLGPTTAYDYFRGIVIDPSSKTRQGCHPYNNNVYCTVANSIERLCCECAHKQFTDSSDWKRYESCNTSGSGCKSELTDCDAKADTNMFQSLIDSEKTTVRENIDRNIATLKSQYELYTQRNLLVPNDVGCCQSTQFRGISASNITFDNISNQCTITK